MKSVCGNIWQQKIFHEEYVSNLKRQLMVSDLLAKLLSIRCSDVEQAAAFLSSKIKHLLPDPNHLLDMQKAVQRTIKAINSKQKICIFADYDVDGATSSALLKSFFRDIDIEVDIYVPDRIGEGYGPTNYSMQVIRDKGIELIITVDCGTTAVEAIEYANKIGLEVIVIDHHISVDNLPKAIAVVNPNRLDENSQYKYLAAVGVSFLFIVALTSELKSKGYFATKLPPNLMQYLDLVALGTVCDVMPIIDLNRAFVVQGLKVMMQRRNIGIKTLCDIANIDSALSCYHLGFILGPRINAGGRVGRAWLGANLLSTTSAVDALKYAQELEQYNIDRKAIELLMLDEAIKIAETQIDSSILFVIGVGWHAGVIGIIASRLKDRFNKPVAVIALNDGVGKASCRSIAGINFGNKIIEAKNAGLIVSGGGHAMAGGFTVLEEYLTELHKYFNKIFEPDIKNLVDQEVKEYEAEFISDSINMKLMEEIKQLEPFGNGNIEPVFKFSNLFVLKANIVGTNHISCLLATSKKGKITGTSSATINAIAFNSVNQPIGEILLNPKAHSISIIGTLKLNHWQNTTKIQVQIKDIILD